MDKNPTLSNKEALIMELLMQRQAEDLYGLELVRRSGNLLKRGTIYVTLSRLEDKGFIESRQENKQHDVPGIPRRLYKATAYGRRIYELLQQARDAKQLFAAARAI